MRFLIDSHIFLWFITGSSELKKTNRGLIENEKNEIFISIASFWEISIKSSLGKLEIPGGFESLENDLTRNNINLLEISFSHNVLINKLPFHHKDPFDRMMASQAIIQNLDVISDDKIFDLYLKNTPVKRIF